MPPPTSPWSSKQHNQDAPQPYQYQSPSSYRSAFTTEEAMPMQTAYAAGSATPSWVQQQPLPGASSARGEYQPPQSPAGQALLQSQQQQYQRPPSLSAQHVQYPSQQFAQSQQQHPRVLLHSGSNLSAMTQSYTHVAPSSPLNNVQSHMPHPTASYSYTSLPTAITPSLVSQSPVSHPTTTTTTTSSSYGYPSTGFTAQPSSSLAFSSAGPPRHMPSASPSVVASHYQHFASQPPGAFSVSSATESPATSTVSSAGGASVYASSSPRYAQYSYYHPNAPNDYFGGGYVHDLAQNHLHPARAASTPASSSMTVEAPRSSTMPMGNISFSTTPQTSTSATGIGGTRGIGRTMSIIHKRVPAACSFCRMRKLRCDGQEPCRQCSRRSIACVYSEGAETRRKRRATTSIVATPAMQIGVGGSSGDQASVGSNFTTFSSDSSSSGGSAGGGSSSSVGGTSGLYQLHSLSNQQQHSRQHQSQEEGQPPSFYARPQPSARPQSHRGLDQQTIAASSSLPSSLQHQSLQAHTQQMHTHTPPAQQKERHEWTVPSDLYALGPATSSNSMANLGTGNVQAVLPSGLASHAFGGGQHTSEPMQTAYTSHEVDSLRDGSVSNNSNINNKTGSNKHARQA